MVEQAATEQTYFYPVVETTHKDNICHFVFVHFPSPSRDTQVSIRAQEVGLAVKSLDGAGVPGVEVFLPGDGASPAMLYQNSRAILLCPSQVKFS